MQIEKDNLEGTITEITEKALEYYKKGFKVIPISKPDFKLKGLSGEAYGKTPKSLWIHLYKFSYFYKNINQDLIKKMFSKEAFNIGILTGKPSGIFVVDVDFDYGGDESMKTLNFPPTLSVNTPNGLHLYYKYPGRFVPTSVKKLAKGIDIAGDTGYVCAPPSIHHSKKQYCWINESVEIAEMNKELLEKIYKLKNRSVVKNIISCIRVRHFAFTYFNRDR